MAVDLPNNCWAFIVDTDTYSGSFERELGAFMTGQYGECAVGKGLAKAALQVIPEALADEFDSEVQQVPDEHGCHRAANICPTPGWFNNGLGGEFPDDGKHEEEAIANWQARCDEEANKDHYADEEANIRNRERWQKRKQEPLSKYPAYMSVAVAFYEQPSEAAAKWMVERAKKFAAGEWQGRMREFFSSFRITAIRLVRLKTDESEVARYL